MGILENKKQLIKEIKHSKVVFLMAHKGLDLDALGSAIGMALVIKKLKRDCFIIIDDKNHEMGVGKVLEEVEGCFNIIKSSDVEKKMYSIPKKNLLIILDTSKQELVQSPEIVDKFSRKVVMDHHEYEEKSISDGLIIVDSEISSTCEMITELIEDMNIEIDAYYATLLLSGIVLDTNSFALKTSQETYYSAYYLSCLGASTKKVQYLLKQDIKEYTERQKLFTDITIINKVAVSKGTNYAKYRREDLAKVADILLYFNGVEACFVIGRLTDKIIGISSRSMGNYPITDILKQLGGGGDQYHGAARIEDESIGKVNQRLIKLIQEQGEDE